MRSTHSALLNKLVGHYPHGLDVELMQQAAFSLVGMHDFSSFRASDCQARKWFAQFTKHSYIEMAICCVLSLPPMLFISYGTQYGWCIDLCR